MGGEYSMKRIEDWDFRDWRSPFLEGGSAFGDPKSLFLQDNFFTVLAIDQLRMSILASLLDKGFLTLDRESGDAFLTPEGELVLPHVTSLRNLLTSGGRLHRRIVKSLVREWERNGRLRFTVLPPNLRESFPGLFPDDH